MAEAQIQDILQLHDQIEQSPESFPENNYILRDIDGLPYWVEDITLPEAGDEFHPLKIIKC